MSYTATDHERATGQIQQQVASLMHTITQAERQWDQLRETIKFIRAKAGELKAMPGAEVIHDKAWASIDLRLQQIERK